MHVGDIAESDELEHGFRHRVAIPLHIGDAILQLGRDHLNALLREDDLVDEIVYPFHSAGELLPLEFETHVDILRECSRVEAAPFEANGYCEPERKNLLQLHEVLQKKFSQQYAYQNNIT